MAGRWEEGGGGRQGTSREMFKVICCTWYLVIYILLWFWAWCLLVSGDTFDFGVLDET